MNALDNASIKDDNSKGPTSFALPEAKSSKTGVSVRYVHFPKSKNVSYRPYSSFASHDRFGWPAHGEGGREVHHQDPYTKGMEGSITDGVSVCEKSD